jgi:medium-chain acyl-[acyl-carrier-protein] hydrolase
VSAVPVAAGPCPWLVRLAGSETPRLRLFAFPYSGGSAGAYAGWSGWLPGDIELSGVQLPGRAMRIAEPPVADMDRLVARLLPDLAPLLERPYVMFGHSNGALIAFAVANRVLHQGLRPPEAMILSAKRSPTVKHVSERISTLPDEQFLQKLKALDGTPRELLDQPEIMRLFYPALRADFALGENYEPGAIHPSLRQLPALLLAGDRDEMAAADVFAWRDILVRATTQTLRGGHFFIHTDPQFPAAVAGFCRSLP